MCELERHRIFLPEAAPLIAAKGAFGLRRCAAPAECRGSLSLVIEPRNMDATPRLQSHQNGTFAVTIDARTYLHDIDKDTFLHTGLLRGSSLRRPSGRVSNVQIVLDIGP